MYIEICLTYKRGHRFFHLTNICWLPYVILVEYRTEKKNPVFISLHSIEGEKANSKQENIESNGNRYFGEKN